MNVVVANANESETPLARIVREQGRVKGWVAKQAKIRPSRFSELLSGSTEMRLREASDLARVLGVPIEELAPGGES